MKLVGGSENNITQGRNGENVPHLEIGELILVHFNLIKNSHQKNSTVLYKFVQNRKFGQLLEIYSKCCSSLSTHYSIETRDQIFVIRSKFRKIIIKNLSGKYAEKLLHHAKQSSTDALKTDSKKIHKNSRG